MLCKDKQKLAGACKLYHVLKLYIISMWKAPTVLTDTGLSFSATNGFVYIHFTTDAAGVAYLCIKHGDRYAYNGLVKNLDDFIRVNKREPKNVHLSTLK